MVTRTERGWGGHFCCAHRCLFRRNTLLECGDVRVVVSTVGGMIIETSRSGKRKIEEIGCDRYYETMAFHAHREEDRYWDADVGRQVYFDSPCAIDQKYADDLANDMHEVVVSEIEDKLERGLINNEVSPEEDV